MVKLQPEYGWHVSPEYAPISYGSDYKNSLLYISNGYVSYSNPGLYLMNSRIKKIRLRDVGTGEYKDYIIADSPHFSKIDAYDVLTSRAGMEIEILEVYEGTIFEDTCINFIGVLPTANPDY